MPTAARLVAAFALAAASAAMVLVLISAYPDERFDRDMVEMMQLMGLVGFLVGWRGLGRKIAEDNNRTGIVLGLRAAVTVTFWSAFWFAIVHVWGSIWDADFQGKEPIETVFLLVNKTVEYLNFVLHPRVLGFGLFFGVLVGVLTRNTHHRWS